MPTPSENVLAAEQAMQAMAAANATLTAANAALSDQVASLTAENATLKQDALSPEALAAIDRMVAMAAPTPEPTPAPSA